MKNMLQGILTGVWGATSAAAVLLFSLSLVSCATPPSVAAHVDYCCWAGAESVDTYRVEFAEMPEFLKPMLRDEASIVLEAKGLEYTEGDADAILVMTFVNRTLEAGVAAGDEAWETIAPGGGVRFIAEVQFEMKEAASGQKIWSATMGRVHNVYEGSYMHDAPARTAMRNAFLKVLADFPAKTRDSGQ